MVLAYDYPLFGIFLSTMWFFVWVLWLMTLFHVFGDIFRSPDLSGLSKGLWTMFVIVLPFVGVFAYVIARGGEMGARRDARREDRYGTVSYDEARNTTVNVADQIAQLGHLREDGAITDSDYEAAKAKILA